MTHDYLSTACHPDHDSDHHGQCRLRCKYCPAGTGCQCRCPRHTAGQRKRGLSWPQKLRMTLTYLKGLP